MTGDTEARLPGSFRDPAGFMFQRDGTFFRQVNRSYGETLADILMKSGLYAKLVEQGLLIPHETADLRPGAGAERGCRNPAGTARICLVPVRVVLLATPGLSPDDPAGATTRR